ncbi:MAG: hypothetical protein MK322_14575, partial [Pseudomonadales bacterium]|nr:hypothetical protein [Pseudomonadales bacterium]
DELMGPDTVNTMAEATMSAFDDHGDPVSKLTTGHDKAQSEMKALIEAGVSIDSITDELLIAGVKAFADSYESLLNRIDEKLQAIG